MLDLYLDIDSSDDVNEKLNELFNKDHKEKDKNTVEVEYKDM